MTQREFLVGEYVSVVRGLIDERDPAKIAEVEFIGKIENYLGDDEIILATKKGDKYSFFQSKSELARIEDIERGETRLRTIEGAYSLQRANPEDLGIRFTSILEQQIAQLRIGADTLPEIKRAGALTVLRNLNRYLDEQEEES